MPNWALKQGVNVITTFFWRFSPVFGDFHQLFGDFHTKVLAIFTKFSAGITMFLLCIERWACFVFRTDSEIDF
jgi:hypothetical protein